MLNNFIYAQSKAMFEERLHEVPNDAIVFIEDTKEIGNHGHYFAGNCGFDPTAFSNLQTAVSQIQTEFLPKSGGTIDGDFAVTGEVTVRDFDAQFATISTAVGDIADFGSLILHDSNDNTIVDFFHTNENLAKFNKNVSIATATNPALSISSNEQGFSLVVEKGEAAFVDGITVGNVQYSTDSTFYSSIDVKSNLKVDGTFSAFGTLTVGRKEEDGNIAAFVDVDGSLQTTGQLIADDGVIGYGTSNFNNLEASNVDAATASINDVEIVNLETDFIEVNDAIKFDGTPEIKYRSAHDEDTLFEVFNVRNANEKLSAVYDGGNHALMGYAQTSALNNYLPKSGGTVTGDFVVSGYSTFNKKVNFSQGASVQNWLRIGSKPYGSQTTTNAYGFINVEQIESAQISALYIGSCYGGSNPVDLGTNPPAEYSAGGTAQTAIGMYRGSVGIGGKGPYTNSDGHTKGSLRWLGNNNYSLGTTNGLYVGGAITCDSTITGTQHITSSDATLKNFRGDIFVDFEKLKSLPKKYFSWKSDETEELHIGTSAQDVQKVYPELVTTVFDDKLGVDYSALSVVALAAIDKLYEENQELKARLDRLENK